ncbi:hypothetical protein I4F81_008787 [Pyropia yezoensis]|uniref:Uncharacterized protein n=1 Tax=Pyropia yezoensis TaxID=2788 RepID=A0ACC3C7W0_PYRYE|nr:hypothetical protein I4F81_008787 [Neopyropia yezoensis]
MPTPIAAVEGGAPSSPRKRRVTSTLPAAASAGGGAAGPAAGTTAAQRTADSHPAEGGHLPSTASGSSRLRAPRDRRKELRDALAGAERDIKKIEAVTELLEGRLDDLDKQLARPGLNAETAGCLQAERVMLFGKINVANAALAGLYEDKRRIKDDLSSVVQRLEAARLPDVSVQYSSHQLSDRQLQLRGSGDIVQELQRCALKNLDPAAGRPKVLVVSDPAGSGKTRVGFEALCRSSGRSGDLLSKLEQSAGCDVLTISLFIDFNNGLSFSDDVDGVDMDLNLGVRLAARALLCGIHEVSDRNGGSLRGLTTGAVLTAIAKGALRRASEAAAAPPGVVLLALHLDEYQVYLNDLKELQGRTSEGADLCFKKMLSAANDLVCAASAAVGAKLVFFPVVTGTPVACLKLLLSDKLSQVAVTPDRLLLVESAELMADILTAHPERSPLRPGVLEALLGSDQARNALSDTDFLPRHVVNLGKEALKVLPPAAHAAAMVSGIDWALAMGPVVMSTLPEVEVRNASTLALLALSRAPVDLNGTSLPFADDVTTAAVSGVVKLVSVGDDRHVVRIPLIQLRRWGLASILPAHLLSETTCTWEQVEVIVGYCLTAALLPGLRSSPLFVQDLFPDALGCDHLPPWELILNDPCSLYVEQTQFISPNKPVPQKQMAVRARKESGAVHKAVLLTDGVFLTCRGNMAVDIRFSCPMRRRGKRRGVLHVLVQTKHTTTNRKLSDADVDAWYKSVAHSTKKWRSGGDQVLFVYFSSKHLTDDGAGALHSTQFFESHPGLVVVTNGELSRVLPPFLLTRVTTTAQEQG